MQVTGYRDTESKTRDRDETHIHTQVSRRGTCSPVLDLAHVLTCQQPSQRPLSNQPIHGGSGTFMHLFKATVKRQSDLGMPNMCMHASVHVPSTGRHLAWALYVSYLSHLL